MLDKKLIGHVFEPFSTVIEAGQVRLFCEAIGETNPIHLDEAAAKAAGYRSILAPPTFVTAVTYNAPQKGGLLGLLGVDIGWLLHGEQHYEYHAPIQVGDRLTCQERITDIYDKKNGALWFVVTETDVKNSARQPVVTARCILVVRNPSHSA